MTSLLCALYSSVQTFAARLPSLYCSRKTSLPLANRLRILISDLPIRNFHPLDFITTLAVVMGVHARHTQQICAKMADGGLCQFIGSLFKLVRYDNGSASNAISAQIFKTLPVIQLGHYYYEKLSVNIYFLSYHFI